ncbi:MAG TPA: DNA polymerase I [Oligoflexia bacterium]|nr:DNA polymerase I [Oligoflexia bacterium]HMP27892.1 DNA polymerase I [Oligoflexia bacterium]
MKENSSVVDTADKSSTQPDGYYLIDGSGYIFRAFYGVAPLSNSKGLPTNAIFGFTKMLIKLLRQESPKAVGIFFDASRKSFRSDLYPNYKANRKETPAELEPQFPYFREISLALGLPVFEKEGLEADDLIASFAMALAAEDRRVVIVSGDKDLLQLVSPQITVYDPMREQIFDRGAVIKKFGVPPEKMVDLLALLGDSSDNVPGLKGAGPKTATLLLEKYQSLENILMSADQIAADRAIRGRESLARNIRDSLDQLRLSKQLVTVKSDLKLADLNGKLGSSGETFSDVLSGQKPDLKRLSDLFLELEFDSLLPTARQLVMKTGGIDNGFVSDVKVLFADDLQEFASSLSKQPAFAFDLEANSLDPKEGRLIGMSFSWGDANTYYLPLACAAPPPDKDLIKLQDLLDALRQILSDNRILKIGQNLKYDLSLLFEHGIEVEGAFFDTMVAAYLLHPDTRGYNLTDLASRYLDRQTIEYFDIVPKGSDFSSVDLPMAATYAGQDSLYAWLLYQKLTPLLEENGLTQLARQIEFPLVKLLARMELAGITIDISYLQKMSEEVGVKLAELEERIYELAGGKFNLNSPKQLAEILFGKLAIPSKGLKRKKTGVSTDSSVLEKIIDFHPLPSLLLEYRELFKLKSTYLDTLPALVSLRTGRLHTSFNQTTTGTGRLSSSNPNLQNIPIQTELGRRIRGGFVAPAGRKLIFADYSQIELRVLAELSGDLQMQRAFTEKLDIHAETARNILGLSADQKVTPDQRRLGKVINFGIIYGMGAFRLARDLKVPRQTASEFIERYFQRFAGVKEYFEKLKKEARGNDKVKTFFGRLRIISEIDRSERDESFVDRVATNAPIQGTAADIVKLAMLAVQSWLDRSVKNARLLLQIHDELVIEAPAEEVVKITANLPDLMTKVVDFKVPLEIKMEVGDSWQ